MYIAGVGKRRDSWAGVPIYRTAKKAISYQATLELYRRTRDDAYSPEKRFKKSM